MQHEQVTRPSTKTWRENDMVMAWPAPASGTCVEDLEPHVLEREIKFAVSSLMPIQERLTALVRRREEREFHADDRDACLAVLSDLFRSVQPYGKSRSSRRVDDVIVCLDSLPFGCFVELELTPAIGEIEEAGAVESVVTLLGLQDAQRIQASYARLRQEWEDLLNKYVRKAGKTSR